MCVSQSITQSLVVLVIAAGVGIAILRAAGSAFGSSSSDSSRGGAAPHSIRSALAMAPRQILVTNSVPYLNADLHLGHLLEHIHTDIWVRFQRSLGPNVARFPGDGPQCTA